MKTGPTIAPLFVPAPYILQCMKPLLAWKHAFSLCPCSLSGNVIFYGKLNCSPFSVHKEPEEPFAVLKRDLLPLNELALRVHVHM